MRRALRVPSLPFLSLIAFLVFAVALATGCGSNNNSNRPITPGGTSGGGTGGSGGGSGSGGGTGGTTGGTGGGTPSPSTVAYVYVGGTNSNNPNLITGFNVTPDGVAHALPGSPYTGPAGFVVTNGAYVFATDGTNIQSYTRNPDGTLVRGPSISGVAHNDSPVGSGVGALTLDRTGQDLYAGEINFQGADNDAVASFAVGSGGNLNFIANSAISVNSGGQLTFSQDNRYAYGQGCYFINWDLFAMARQSNGSLQFVPSNAAIPSTGNPNDMVCPQASSASAKNYLALEAGIVGNGATTPFLVTYTINSDGTLTLIPNSNVQTTIGGQLAFDPSGNFLAVAGQGGIQVFQLGSNGVLVPIGTPQQPSITFNAVKWDTTGHLYAVADSGLYIFSSNAGMLTASAGSPYPVSLQGSLTVLPTK